MGGASGMHIVHTYNVDIAAEVCLQNIILFIKSPRCWEYQTLQPSAMAFVRATIFFKSLILHFMSISTDVRKTESLKFDVSHVSSVWTSFRVKLSIVKLAYVVSEDETIPCAGLNPGVLAVKVGDWMSRRFLNHTTFGGGLPVNTFLKSLFLPGEAQYVICFLGSLTW